MLPIFSTHLVVALQTLSDSTENFLKILTFFLDPQPYESSENCLKLPKTVLDFRELFETLKNCLKISRTIWEF